MRVVQIRYEGIYGDQADPPNGWGDCGTHFDGTGSVWDQNATTGYRCIDSVGVGAGDLLSGNFPNKINTVTGTQSWPHQAQEPIYEWMDSWTLVPQSGGFFWGNEATAVIVQNSDYYLDCSPSSLSGCTSFDGTQGVGHGTLAARPTTCTKGVGYWATDQGNWNQSGNGFGQGELFLCTATDTWTLYYTPLTYPHPLTAGQASGPPAAPTGLTVTVH